MGAGRRHVEIYLPLQVMVVFTDDKPTLVTHIASGELDANGQPKQWCETTTYDTDADGSPLPEPVVKQECAYSKTPGGLFRFRRKVEGNRVGPLGGMYNPVYFNYGIAVHGAKNVPKEPASHGCVRINMDIAEYFPDLVKVGDAVYVWGHDGKEPEGYTRNESLPSFNQPDPSATTTTSTTTTSTTTTVPASTTTTKPPSTTTTTKPPTTWTDMESEDHTTWETAQPIAVGQRIFGVVDSATQYDWYAFTTPTEKSTVSVKVQAQGFGSPLTPRLQLYFTKAETDGSFTDVLQDTWDKSSESASLDPDFTRAAGDGSIWYLKVRYRPETPYGDLYWYIIEVEVDY
jgi:hypothetical protein